MKIVLDDLTSPEVHDLLHEHLREMQKYSPPESVHALDIDALRGPDISFWTAWEDGELLGCGALKRLTPEHVEIKSMRTATAHLRKGVASEILTHLIEQAKSSGYKRISLETGSVPAFDPARRLYESFGFTYCGPFADYLKDGFSVFMTLEIH